MVKSPHIEQLILRNELAEVSEAIADSNSYYHMQSFNQDLQRLLKQGVISQDVALEASPSPEDLRLALQGMVRDRKR
jgi:Tfp pilus assembly ATPase PilU